MTKKMTRVIPVRVGEEEYEQMRQQPAYRDCLFIITSLSIRGLCFPFFEQELTREIRNFSSLNNPRVREAIDNALGELQCLIAEYEYPSVFYMTREEDNKPLLWSGNYLVNEHILRYITDGIHNLGCSTN